MIVVEPFVGGDASVVDAKRMGIIIKIVSRLAVRMVWPSCIES